jgi:fumarate reductase flavoprotein subunit
VRGDAVIMCTGGFGASHEMLQEFCPRAAAFPTTNGPWATGDGMRLGDAVGARLVDMDKVTLKL